MMALEDFQYRRNDFTSAEDGATCHAMRVVSSHHIVIVRRPSTDRCQVLLRGHKSVALLQHTFLEVIFGEFLVQITGVLVYIVSLGQCTRQIPKSSLPT
jgi:hypothetical protein